MKFMKLRIAQKFIGAYIAGFALAVTVIHQLQRFRNRRISNDHRK